MVGSRQIGEDIKTPLRHPVMVGGEGNCGIWQICHCRNDAPDLDQVMTIDVPRWE
jgi:hypothetical protein